MIGILGTLLKWQNLVVPFEIKVLIAAVFKLFDSSITLSNLHESLVF